MWVALTSTDICPDLVDPKKYGEHSSKVLKEGVRTWYFETEIKKLQFLASVQKGHLRRDQK